MPHAPIAPDWDGRSHEDVPEFPTRDDIEAQARDEGMDVAAINSADWQQAARDWFSAQPLYASFSSDDLTAAIGVPASQGAVGAAFGGAAKRGDIKASGYDKSRREGRHLSRTLRWVKAVPAVTTPPSIHTFMCTGCQAVKVESDLYSKYGKPQVVGFIREKRLMEAKCAKCNAKPRKGLQAIWREQ